MTARLALEPIFARMLTAPAPIRGVLIEASPLGIRRVRFADTTTAFTETPHPGSEHSVARRHADAAAEQLMAYFAGQRREFDLPLDLQGTPFQQRVWAELLRVPFGETATYAQLAAAIGNPKACRTVGLANGANPIAVVVPCHRVIGSDRRLTGFAGGIERKAWLLDHEGVGAGLFGAVAAS